MKNKIILVIEDDHYISELIKFNLERHYYNVILAKDANEGLMFLKNNLVDLVILDLMLPGLQGEEFTSLVKSKEKFKNLPILVITAKSDEELFVKLLREGIDDFLVKPFSMRILIAKLEAILRRVENTGAVISSNGIEIFTDEFVVKVDGKELNLTKTEFEILKVFLKNKGKVLSREKILHEVWGLDVDISDRTIDVHISKIRKKLGKKGILIKSISKVGYKFSS